MSKTLSKSTSEVPAILPDDWPELDTAKRQQWVERYKNALQARRNVIELMMARERFAAEIDQQRADVAKLEDEIAAAEKSGALPGHRLLHMRARLRVHDVEIRRRQALRQQQADEIELYQAILYCVEGTQ